MVLFKNIRATVIRYDDEKPYHEYKLTQQPTKRSQTVKEAYVEVSSGERFAVVVDILSKFDFQSAPDVRIRWRVDGMEYSGKYISRKEATSTHMGAEIGTLQRRIWDCDTRKIDGKWMQCALVFADLQLDEDAEPTIDQTEHTAKTCGIINIDVTRGTLESVEPEPWSEQIPEVTSASKDIVKKRHISNAVNLEESEQPVVDSKFTPVKGKSGAPLRVNLLYRSRNALELLKVIPKTSLAPHAPSPSPATLNRRADSGTKHMTPNSSFNGGDAEQPPSKRAKKETEVAGQTPASGTRCERPLPQIKYEQEIVPNIGTTAGNNSVSPSNAPPSVDHRATKLSPILIKDEDEDEDLVIVSATPAPRAHSTTVPTQAGVSVAPVQHGDQVQRERKKAILKMRLEKLKIDREELKIEQERLKIEQELLEMED